MPKKKPHTGKPDKPEDMPEQKLGDTPVPPWRMPRPKKKQQARPVREALQAAVAEVDSEEKAEAVAGALEATLAGVTGEAVAQAQPAESARQAAADVQAAARQAADGDRPAQVLAETARVVEATSGEDQEAVAEAVQEALSPEQQGAQPPEWYGRRRDTLRQALLKRMQPLEALDANLFIRINHLPHTRLSNGFFYFLTFIYNGGAAWYALMLLAMLARGRWSWHMVRASAVPLTLATAIVEFPIKSFFRRRRPFISLVRAIVVGKKPGTWSFPSGHAASAFAGAWLLRQHFPVLAPMFYCLAALVAFSRVYLGDHYPGDVISGSLVGHFLARLFGRLLGHKRRPRRRR